MIDVTKLLCNEAHEADHLRYGYKVSGERKPIVIWNCTRKCNLKCVHCYASSEEKEYSGELDTKEAKYFIDDIARFGCPVILFSGGEPLMRPDLFDLGHYAYSKGLRAVISTNGTLIDKDAAKEIKKIGFTYVGISLDGIGSNNDKFRGKKGAFDDAIRGIENCKSAGVKVGLRFTLNKLNQNDLENILDFLPEAKIPRCCIYHLVYSGRAKNMKKHALSSKESLKSVDLIFDKAKEFHNKNLGIELLTVDNHTDGVYLYLKLLKENPARALEVYQLLKRNGGNNSGIAISDVDNLGYVHADQFWQHYSFGNVRERKFADIWMDTSDPLMAGLKDRKPLLKGKCGKCKFLDICNGNFRVRAEAVFDDIWQEDPACYLTEEEVAK